MTSGGGPYLHRPLAQAGGLALGQVDGGGGHRHRGARLDGEGLGGSLGRAVRLHLGVGSHHHRLLLVVPEGQRRPSPAGGVVLGGVVSVAAAVVVAAG